MDMVTVMGRCGKAVLELDSAAGGDHRRGEQRRDVPDGDEAGADTRGARSRSPAHRRGGPRARGSAATGRGRPAARAAADAEHVREHAQRTDRRHQRRELAADAAYLAAELAARGAVVHVPAGETAGTHAAVMGDYQLLADLRASRVTRFARLGEADPRAHEQRLDGGDRHAERAGDVGVRHPAEFAHQQRRALLLGQPPHVLDQPPQRFALLSLGNGVVGASAEDPEHLGRRWDRSTQLVHAAVVRNAVQPCAERQLTVRGAQARVSAHEDVLQRVLGVLPRARQHLPRVREQPLPVAVVDDAERLLVTVAEQRHELFVGAQS